MVDRAGLAAVVVLVAAAAAVVTAAPIGQLMRPAQRRNDTLNVFFIPHSHCDAGWLKTIDEYYEQDVKQIYNTVTEELSKRGDRKFIIVEMIFFSRWFKEATETQRSLIKQFVAQERVEFVLGGWVMNDDADPTYGSSANQMAEGHKWIYETFGVTPRYGWHIDPFGLSSYYPTMFAKMGFNGHVINRIHYAQKNEWKSKQHMEFIWRGTNSLGTSADVFTHVLDSHYSFPSGYNFDYDPPITDANIAVRAANLVAEFQKRAAWFRTNNLLIPGGDDFRWQNAYVQYSNWDLLIDYINANPSYGVNIQYATLHDYFEAVNAVDTVWPVYATDFFPYADNGDSYWTGYFTSYANAKSLTRTSATLLRNAEVIAQAGAFAGAPVESIPSQLVPLRQATAEVQHHDGVTGTSKNYVMQMYVDHLTNGTDPASQVVGDAISAIVGEPTDFSDTPDNIADLTGNNVVPIVLTNGLGWARSAEPVDIILNRNDIEIVDRTGTRVMHQITEFGGKITVTFLADIPAAGLNTYFARPTTSPVRATVSQVAIGEEVVMGNAAININLAVANNGIVSFTVVNRSDGSSIPVKEQIMEYHSVTSGQASGAYIFRPNGQAQALSSVGTVSLIVGPVFQQVVHTYDNAHTQSFRIVASSNSDVSSRIDVGFGLGTLQKDREAIARFTSTAFNANNVRLHSDNNGLLMHERPPASGQIQQNYYPMVYQAYLSDDNMEMLAVVDRTVGVASLSPGQMEFMLHRRCSRDDGRGVGEALDDQSVTYPHIYLYFGRAATIENFRPRMAITLQHPPLPYFGPITTLQDWSSSRATIFTGLTSPLPNNIHLLAIKSDSTVNNWSTAILRLQHIYESDSRSGLGVPVTVDITTLLRAAVPYSVSEELNLSGVLPVSALPRMTWQAAAEVTPSWQIPNSKHVRPRNADQADEDAATLFNPMEIHVVRLMFSDLTKN